jgi:hypothetical protein
MLHLYLISQDTNQDCDTYDSAVVAAVDEYDAREIHPSGNSASTDDYAIDSWASPYNVEVKFLGYAAPGITRGVICASFNAG